MTEQLTGEERLKRRNRQKWIVTACLFASGAVLGFAVMRAEDVMGFDFGGPWPREVALAALALLTLSLTIGTIVQHRQFDDFERAVHTKAAAFAATVVLVGYPVWFLLWKAQLVPAPTHWGPPLVGLFALYAGYGWYRFR